MRNCRLILRNCRLKLKIEKSKKKYEIKELFGGYFTTTVEKKVKPCTFAQVVALSKKKKTKKPQTTDNKNMVFKNKIHFVIDDHLNGEVS